MKTSNRIMIFRVILAVVALVLVVLVSLGIRWQTTYQVEVLTENRDAVDKRRVLAFCSNEHADCELKVTGESRSTTEVPVGADLDSIGEHFGILRNRTEEFKQSTCSTEAVLADETFVAWGIGTQYTYRVWETSGWFNMRSTHAFPGIYEAYVSDPGRVSCEVVKTKDLPDPVEEELGAAG